MGGVFNQVAGVLSRNLVAIFIETISRPGVGREFLTQKTQAIQVQKLESIAQIVSERILA